MRTSDNFSPKKGFAPIIFLLLIVGVGILGGAYFFKSSQNNSTNSKPTTSNSTYQQTGEKPDNNSTAPKKITCSVAGQNVEIARESSDGAFTASITDIDKISVISPGKLVGDARLTYLWIKDKQRVPVFAPADGTLIHINYKTRVDLPPGMSKPDYDLLFLVDCKTMYRLNHITDPNPEIAALKPIAEPLQLGKGHAAPSDKDTTPKVNIIVKAGQQIGTTTGTPAAQNFDFGLFIDQVSVCPYEKFNEPIRSAWLTLLGDTTKPIKGTPCEVSGDTY